MDNKKRMFRRLRYLTLILVMYTILVAFTNTHTTTSYAPALGNVISVTSSEDKLTIITDNGSNENDDILELSVLKSNILKINYRPNSVEESPDTPMIDPNKTWNSVGATITTNTDPMQITTLNMIVEISKNPCRLTIKKADGTTLLWEPLSGGVFNDGVRFLHPSDHNIYGIRGYDFSEETGNILRNNSSHAAHAGQQGDCGGPILWSTAGYGLIVDSDGGYPYTESATGKLEFYYGEAITEGRRYEKNDLDFYITLGTPKEIMGSIAEITGETPMMPKWSLGFMNFEWGIDETELNNIVDRYRAKNIPIDAYALDYDWKKYGDTNYGEFTWNTSRFPSSATNALKTVMNSKGIKLIGITKPRIVTIDGSGNRTTQYIDANNAGYWYPGQVEYQDYFIPDGYTQKPFVRSIDPYNASERAWFWEHSKTAFSKGIVGWWNDETDKVSSGSTSYWFGNYTTNNMCRGMYEGQRAFTTERVMQTSRTFYPGAQRYATSLWSGDIGIQFYKGQKPDLTWATGMQEQRSRMLSAINLGQGKWGMDAGGFNPSSYNPNPELYARWIQFSSVTPVFRVHGNKDQQRQPWEYGNTAEESAKAAIQLRYMLMPYIYAYERTLNESGVGYVRPLVFDYPNDLIIADETNEWMLGDWLLTAPVVDQYQTQKSIYLPAGTWIDYNRGITYSGEQTIQYPVNAETYTDLPIFIKKGAIIPSQRILDYVDQSTITTVGVDIFPDTTQTSFTYYDDNGSDYSYENSGYFKQVISAQDLGNHHYKFIINTKSGDYSPALQYYLVKLHGKASTSVTINDSPITLYSDLTSLKAASVEGWAKGKDIYGEVTYVKVAAGSASVKIVNSTGSTTSDITSYKYEAEEASLSGNSLDTRPVVNNNHAGYSGTGFVGAFTSNEAAITFYAKAKVAGDYNVSLKYANATGSSKTMSIFVNGTRVKQTTLPNLVNWDTWGTQTELLPLTSGNNIITIKYYPDTGDTGNIKLDYITIPFEPFISLYQAECNKLSGGASINRNHLFYSGAAFVDGFTAVGANISFEDIYVPTAGSYKVNIRYANGGTSAKTLSTYVNGSKVSQISLPKLSSWDTWGTHEQTVTLNAGKNIISYQYDSGDTANVNIDRILVYSSVSVTPASEVNLLDDPGFERPISYTTKWVEWHPAGQNLAYGRDSGSSSNPPESPKTGDMRAWFNLPSAFKQSIHQTLSVPNGVYKVEALVKYFGKTATACRLEIDYDTAVNISKDGVWKYISAIKSVTSGQIDIGFYVDSPGETVLLVDDVKLYRLD